MFQKKDIRNSLFLIITFLLLIGFCIYYSKKQNNIEHNYSKLNEIVSADQKLDSLLSSDPLKARMELEKLYRVSSASNDTILQLRAYYYKINEAVRKNKLHEISDYYNNVISLSNKNSPYFEARFDKVMAIYYIYLQDYSTSLNLLLKSESYFQKQNDLYNLGIVYSYLGSLYQTLGEINTASNYFDQAENCFLKGNTPQRIPILEANRAKLYMDKGDYSHAKKSLTKVLNNKLIQRDTMNRIRTLSMFSYVALNQGDSREALKSLNEAYELSVNTKDTIFQSLSLAHYGNIYSMLNNFPKAIDYYKKSLELIPENNLDAQIFRNIALALNKNKQYEEAYNYLNHYSFLNDSIKRLGRYQEIRNIEKLLEQDKGMQNRFLEKQKRIKLVWIFSSVLLIVLAVSLIIGLLYRSNKRKLAYRTLEHTYLLERFETRKEMQNLINKKHDEDLEAQQNLLQLQNDLHRIEKNAQREIKALQLKQHIMDMDSKNRELAMMNMQLIAKSKLVTDINKVLQSFPDKKSFYYKELQDIIKKSSSQKNDWEQFQKLFKEIHPDFFHNLHIKNIGLTRTELQICAYIKINMDNRSISYLLNINHASLMTNRYHLRKKFGLEHRSDDLDQFIKTF